MCVCVCVCVRSQVRAEITSKEKEEEDMMEKVQKEAKYEITSKPFLLFQLMLKVLIIIFIIKTIRHIVNKQNV